MPCYRILAMIRVSLVSRGCKGSSWERNTGKIIRYMETTSAVAWPWLLPWFPCDLQHLLWLLSGWEVLPQNALVESIFPSGGTTTTMCSRCRSPRMAASLRHAFDPPSWHLYYRLLGVTFCDRKPKFPVLCLIFFCPSEHILCFF